MNNSEFGINRTRMLSFSIPSVDHPVINSRESRSWLFLFTPFFSEVCPPFRISYLLRQRTAGAGHSNTTAFETYEKIQGLGLLCSILNLVSNSS